MKLTKLFFPKTYDIHFIKQSEHILDIQKMKDKNYPEVVIKYFENHPYSYGYTEPIDQTINRWLLENKLKVSVIDIKYQGFVDDNNSPSALIFYETI